jgi:hypothetical protein
MGRWRGHQHVPEIETMDARDEQTRLAAAITALRRGQQAEARRLIVSILDENPRSEAAWTWACQVAATAQERIHCLKQILALNPEHTAARRYLEQLQPAETPAVPQPETAPPAPAAGARTPGPRLVDILLAPVGCLLQASAPAILITLLALAVAGGFLYYRANTNFLGLVGPDFGRLTFSESREEIDAGDVYWKIAYEKTGTSEFSGLVRHVSPIRMEALRVLTHDVLVTSGEYADPSVVHTSVVNHHFYWRSPDVDHPKGRINLLHTIPANDEIYQQLLAVRSGDEVTIAGREILSVQAYDRSGRYLGEWHDEGCNTLVVESVTIHGGAGIGSWELGVGSRELGVVSDAGDAEFSHSSIKVPTPTPNSNSNSKLKL